MHFEYQIASFDCSPTRMHMYLMKDSSIWMQWLAMAASHLLLSEDVFSPFEDRSIVAADFGLGAESTQARICPGDRPNVVYNLQSLRPPAT